MPVNKPKRTSICRIDDSWHTIHDIHVQIIHVTVKILTENTTVIHTCIWYLKICRVKKFDLYYVDFNEFLHSIVHSRSKMCRMYETRTLTV